MITRETPAWWFGCWLTAGHFLVGRDRREARECPFYGRLVGLDGGLAPRWHKRTGAITFVYRGGKWDNQVEYDTAELPQGQFLRHYIAGVAILSWWDRTQGDIRSACNSSYLVLGGYTSSEMLEWFPLHFPLQAERLKTADIRLIEVFVS
jgi:hypothetical protein